MNSNTIKNIAIVFMAIEHLSRIAVRVFDYPALDYLLHYTGRIVFPLFVFLMVEGFFKTSSRKRYIKRIFLAAIIMSVGSYLLVYILSLLMSVDINILFASRVPLFQFLAPVGRNIFFSLAAGLLLLYLIEQFKKSTIMNKILLGGAMVFVGVFSVITEASVHVVPLFLIFYFFYNQKRRMAIAYSLFSLLWLVDGLLNIEYFWSYNYQWMMIFALPIILLYNGKKGTANMKYFFYAFYPLHLWIIFFIEKWVFNITL